MPSLVTSFQVNSTGQSIATLTTPSFTPQTGDVFVLKGNTEDSGRTLGTPTNTGSTITWTSTQVNSAASHTYNVVWRGVCTAGGTTTTVSMPWGTGGSAYHSIVLEQWRSGKFATTPAVVGTVTGTGAPSTTLTTAASSSVVSWVCGDWAAMDGASRVYRSSATETGYRFASGASTVYFAYQSAASAGSQTVGLSAPAGQTWTVLGVEIQDNPSGSSFSAAAALSGSGTLAASAVPTVPLGATLTGTGTLSATIRPTVPGAAVLSGAGTLTTVPVPVMLATAGLAGTGSLTAGSVASAGATAALSGTGTLAVVGVPRLPALAVLSGSGTLTAGSGGNQAGPASLSGAGTLAASAGSGALSTAALSGSGTLSASQRPIVSAGASLSGSGVLTVATKLAVPGVASLSGGGGLTIVVLAQFANLAMLSSVGLLSAAAAIVAAGRDIVVEVGAPFGNPLNVGAPFASLLVVGPPTPNPLNVAPPWR